MEKDEMLEGLIEKYGTNRKYTARYLKHMLTHHKNNPQFDLYMESGLGNLNRSRALMKSLCEEFHNNNLYSGKDCLDIGSSAGHALIAFVEHGADRAVGISYDGRDYKEGKKIGWKDGISALWCILKYNLFR